MAQRKVKKARTARKIGSLESMPVDFNKARHYVHYDVEKSTVGEFMKNYIISTRGKKVSKCINAAPAWMYEMYSFNAVIAYRLSNGLSVEDRYAKHLEEHIDKIINTGESVLKDKVNDELTDQKKSSVAKPTIQDRIRDKSIDICEELNVWFDGDAKATFDVKGHLHRHEVNQPIARKIISFYQGEYEELLEVSKLGKRNLTDDQKELMEGYSHLSKQYINKQLAKFQLLMDELNMFLETAKATRKPRAKKPVPQEKLVAKMKFKEKDNELKLVSESPVKIFDASQVWVYNTKTKKLGVYHVDDHTTLGVKGTTLLGFNEHSSVQKTLRKPEESLRQFKGLTKTKRNKFLDTLTTKESKLNGRINSDTIILKIV